jgi:transcription antitermination factor NusG
MVMTDDTWHLVRNVRGVTGFVGAENKPFLCRRKKSCQNGHGETRNCCRYAVGDHVRIVDGPLHELYPVLWRRSNPRRTAFTVMVSMFGRETPVDWNWIRWKYRNKTRTGILPEKWEERFVSPPEADITWIFVTTFI